MTQGKRGRPRDTEAPVRIENAARALFAARSFGDTSIRAIADAAGSSPVVVLRHFGSKEQLFLHAMSLDTGLGGVVDGPLDRLGRTILTRLLKPAPELGLAEVWRALMLAGDQKEIQRYRRDAAKEFLVDPVVDRLTGNNAEARAHLISGQVMGLLLLLWVDQDSTLLALPVDDLIDLYAPSLQRLIDG